MINVIDVLHLFDDEQVCKAMVESWRWPDGDPICPSCHETCTRDKLASNGKYYLCDTCGYAFSAWIDTALKGSNLPIDVWLAVIAFVIVDAHAVPDDLIALYVDISVNTVAQMRPRIDKLIGRHPEIIEGVEHACLAEWQRQHGPKAAVL